MEVSEMGSGVAIKTWGLPIIPSLRVQRVIDCITMNSNRDKDNWRE